VDFRVASVGRLLMRQWMGGFRTAPVGGWVVGADALVGGEQGNVAASSRKEGALVYFLRALKFVILCFL
jgi:hypothetical protein